MSTVDSQLLVCSSVISEDFYKGMIKPGASDRELVNLGRISVVVIALIATLLASNPRSANFVPGSLCLGRVLGRLLGR